MHRHRRPSHRWILCLPLLILVLPPAVSGDSDDAPGAGGPGAAVTAAVPHARESFDAPKRRGPARLAQGDDHRLIPLRRTPRPTLPAQPHDSAPESAFPGSAIFAPLPDPLSSTVGASFPGLQNFPFATNRDVIPPDTMGAAGPAHLVSLLNSEFGVFSRTGTLLSSVPLQDFWASLGTAPGEPADFPFDTKILYDQYSSRFVAVTLDCTVAPHSWVLLAVSATSDPTGEWDKWAIDADLDNNSVQSGNSADYPGLGVDGSNVYITANMFSASDVGQYGKVWVVPKAQLLSGSNPITWFEFRNPEHGPPPASFPYFSLQPAHTFGTASAEYLLFEGNGSTLRLARIDNVAGTPVWNASVPVPITPYTPDSSLAGAPQKDVSGLIDTADTRMLNAVYRNGSVWGTHHVGVGASGKTEVAWYRIDAATATAVSQGRVSDASRWYYYPSVAVSKDNVAALGFSGSSAAEYASAFYTLVWPSTGLADAVTLLKAGEATYTKTLGGPSIRWGDFSATSVDPVDDNTFWTLQEYAAAPHQSISMWGTWWGKIVPGEPPVSPSPSSGGGGGSCAVAGRPGFDPVDSSSSGTLASILLPAVLYSVRRIVRGRKAA